jgi:hypothetical protein
MPGQRYWLIALIVFAAAHPSQASVTTQAQAKATTSQTSTPRLAVFGRRRLVNGQRANFPKLDGALAEIAERYTSVPAERPLASLHALNPAARFRLSVPLATPEVLIDAVTTGDPQALKRALQRFGMRDVATFSNDVGGWLPIDRLPAAAQLAELKFARASMPRTRASGVVAAQGDFVQRSAALREAYPSLTGAGVTIGVLSDSFNCYQSYSDARVQAGGFNGYARNGLTATYADDQKSGALPAGVNVLKEASCSDYGAPELLPFSDEGRAILQIAYAVAPDAKLAFYTAAQSEADFANGIIALAQAGAKVIDDDVGYVDEPFFQDGLISQAVDRVAVQGVAYFSSAGNNGRLSYENEAPAFSVTSSSAPNSGEQLLNFDTTGATTTTSLRVLIPKLIPGEYIPLILEWDQPYVTGAPRSGGTTSSIDLCITSASGPDPISDPQSFPNTVTCTGANALGTDPVQVLFIGNPANSGAITAEEEILISVGLANGSPPPGKVKFQVDANGAPAAIESFDTRSPTIQGHASAAGAATIGSVQYFITRACLPDFDGPLPRIDGYSSSGGDPILFTAEGVRLAAPLYRQKPDFAAPDGVTNTFLGATAAQMGFPGSGPAQVPQCSYDPNLPRFLGTSAAAPHAAAAAALLWQANPELTAAQIIAALRESALPMGNTVQAPGVNYDSGFGFIQVDAALARLPAGALLISVSPTSITAGDSATLTWSAANMTGCSASGGWAGAQAAGGTQTVTSNTAGTETYILTCASADRGTVTNSAMLRVNTKSGGSSDAGGGGGGSLEMISVLLLCGLLSVNLGSMWGIRFRNSEQAVGTGD